MEKAMADDTVLNFIFLIVGVIPFVLYEKMEKESSKLRSLYSFGKYFG